jgi:uncharacterized LabA/DUF88 family protein
MHPPERVVSYIDGFNLYFGLKSSKWERYLWLNLHSLGQNLLRPDQTLVKTKYFTSRVSGSADKQKRQSIFIDALSSIPELRIYYGHYQVESQTCRKCGSVHAVHREKKTDVNIAVEMLADAYQDAFDVALLMSADADLAAPVTAVRTLFPKKRVIVAFPPGRSSANLRSLASAAIPIGRGTIAKSLFPRNVMTQGGYVVSCPPSWQ